MISEAISEPVLMSWTEELQNRRFNHLMLLYKVPEGISSDRPVHEVESGAVAFWGAFTRTVVEGGDLKGLM